MFINFKYFIMKENIFLNFLFNLKLHSMKKEPDLTLAKEFLEYLANEYLDPPLKILSLLLEDEVYHLIFGQFLFQIL
jgi:hypothetical protein